MRLRREVSVLRSGNDTFATLLVTLVVGVGTYLLRASSLSLGSRVSWPAWLREWLMFVTPAVLGSLLGPEVFLPDKHWIPLWNNTTFLAAIPAGIVAWFAKNLFLTVMVGVVCFAVVSHFAFLWR
ncbi:MAG: AzlD domain-containing protein [Alicyclobacillus sp.]|nr:AzlD domain-containing protein [Alicyclobacillus sp.]